MSKGDEGSVCGDDEIVLGRFETVLEILVLMKSLIVAVESQNLTSTEL